MEDRERVALALSAQLRTAVDRLTGGAVLSLGERAELAEGLSRLEGEARALETAAEAEPSAARREHWRGRAMGVARTARELQGAYDTHQRRVRDDRMREQQREELMGVSMC